MHLSMLHLLGVGGGSVEQRGLGDVLAEDVALDEVREPNFGLILEVDGCRNREHLFSKVSIMFLK